MISIALPLGPSRYNGGVPLRAINIGHCDGNVMKSVHVCIYLRVDSAIGSLVLRAWLVLAVLA